MQYMPTQIKHVTAIVANNVGEFLERSHRIMQVATMLFPCLHLHSVFIDTWLGGYLYNSYWVLALTVTATEFENRQHWALYVLTRDTYKLKKLYL